MQGIGGLFGWLLVVSIVISLANYPIKIINRRAIKSLPVESPLRKTIGKTARILSRYHRFFSIASHALLITHFFLQITYRYLSLTGLIAGIFIILTSTVGVYGHYIRHKKRSAWFYIHRTIAILIIVAVTIHIVTGGLPAI